MAPCCCCYDEENDGIPPVCKDSRWCPFNLDNPLFAKNKYVKMFCNVGLPYFDKNRRRWQGFAFGWTLTAFIFTIFGCLAVINDKDILEWAFWSWGRSYKGWYRPRQGEDFAEIFMGLRAYYAQSCKWTNSTADGAVDGVYQYNCTQEIISWDVEDEDQIEWGGKCAEACLGTWYGAILSCFTMIFAMIGSIHRMRFIADAPQQKLLGCITDTIGCATLAISLMNLEKDCFMKLEGQDFVDPVYPNIIYPKMYFDRGGGYMVYWLFCFSGCIVRAAIHWLTPLPGMGVGAFTWKLPEEVSAKRAVMAARRTVVWVGQEVQHGMELSARSVRDLSASVGSLVEGEKNMWEERPVPASPKSSRKGRRRSSLGITLGLGSSKESTENDRFMTRQSVTRKDDKDYHLTLYRDSDEDDSLGLRGETRL
ncbi:hypothetical protein TrST_g5225 [Triparma strigata]|uniref:Uncharacterized protein n=1 Tax=Triparma strigata TaxID=1606541 RepID=A0A9W6ZQ46_9STRA|nr:hypothetical protein TrST_g5225 [Triparma strigata]